MSESYKDERKREEPKLIINKPINWPLAQLSKEVKGFRFCTDEEGNVWAMPVIAFKHDSTTDLVVPNPNLTLTDITFQHQADAILSQDDPVSATLYTVLDTTTNVRIISIRSAITWAITQPTPLHIRVTIDGVVYNFFRNDPVTATPYIANLLATYISNFDMDSADPGKSFLLEGRSVKVEVAITWAITQPTPLTCLVRYARRV